MNNPQIPPAPLASTDPTPDDAQAKYERLLSEKLRWFEKSAVVDVRRFGDVSDDQVADALRELRHFAPSACHWAINVALDRLARLREENAELRKDRERTSTAKKLPGDSR